MRSYPIAEYFLTGLWEVSTARKSDLPSGTQISLIDRPMTQDFFQSRVFVRERSEN